MSGYLVQILKFLKYLEVTQWHLGMVTFVGIRESPPKKVTSNICWKWFSSPGNQWILFQDPILRHAQFWDCSRSNCVSFFFKIHQEWNLGSRFLPEELPVSKSFSMFLWPKNVEFVHKCFSRAHLVQQKQTIKSTYLTKLQASSFIHVFLNRTARYWKTSTFWGPLVGRRTILSQGRGGWNG